MLPRQKLEYNFNSMATDRERKNKPFFKSRRAAVSVAALIGIVVVIGIVGAGLIYANNSGWLGTPQTASTVGFVSTPQQPTPSSPFIPTTGDSNPLMANQLVTVTLKPTDQLAATALTEATHTKHTWLLKNSGSNTFTLQGVGAGNFQVSSDGKLWAMLTTQAAGTEYVFSPKYTAMSEANFNNDCTWIDYTNTGTTKNYVCSFNPRGLSPQSINQGAVIPTLNVNTKWLNDAAITLSAPADQTSVGTTTIAKYAQYTVTGTAGDVNLVTRLKVTLNSTNDAKWNAAQSHLRFGDIGKTITLDQMRKDSTTTTTVYECLLDANFNCVGATDYSINQAFPLEFINNGAGTTPLETKITFGLATSDVIAVTVSWDSANAVSGARTVVTDLVNYSA